MDEVILSPIDIRYESAIGCDVHRDTIVCHSLLKTVVGNLLKSKETFATTRTGLRFFVDWCRALDLQKIIMESTGIYWMAPYDALESAKLPINIVNPAHVKRMDGKKTDEEDAYWLAKIAVNGTFTPSYIPPKEYRHLRLECRNTTKMVESLVGYKNK
ncbi:MAG: transposase [Desulfovibrionaceae bacterium]|nr:transposase [Desulfovibrionaceae bacterium]